MVYKEIEKKTKNGKLLADEVSIRTTSIALPSLMIKKVNLSVGDSIKVFIDEEKKLMAFRKTESECYRIVAERELMVIYPNRAIKKIVKKRYKIKTDGDLWYINYEELSPFEMTEKPHSPFPKCTKDEPSGGKSESYAPQIEVRSGMSGLPPTDTINSKQEKQHE